jgi:hypothetical protein
MVMANWLTLSKIEQWDRLFFLGFQYDEIPNEVIAEALCDPAKLAFVDCTVEWQEDRWLSAEKTIPDSKKHAYRIAAIVRALEAGDGMQKAVTLDTFSAARCRSAISDGHHRIRALQYLGLDCAPFSLGGVVSELRKLVDLAGATCPAGATKFFSQQLLAQEADDIKPSRRSPKKRAAPQQCANTFSL